ncbi:MULTISPECIES: SLC13 family permease [Microbacterium]|uniref:SLC13/DASS family transporter n=1 Tax=Microbacterium wangchenii TaxID=2541726 RepID=A0ABX5SWU4_9MICO|nr:MULTISPECIES: SLC13 family permease [Microbacterium]MCK6065946.1 SLC13 family permease [Microbacterium sp. EYE_512]QBR90242.1 SLC13/DASS family transporter [Microbacterium wangchenii]TFV84948.1 SLC13/DASS family transporter [Microbacterium sp. dk485]TXK11743.1 SLC13/DASS family transporter [Microbacterium wangchenii]
MDPLLATLLILAAAILAFLSGRIPLEVIAIGVALALWATGVLTLPEVLAGFGDPTVLFIASLFVVAGALDATGVTRWAGGFIVARAGSRRGPVTIWIIGVAALLTSLISINGAVAALVPVAAVVARRSGIPVSQLMIPLAFAGSAGSLLTLTGTPVNVVASELAEEAVGRPIGFVEFALVGGPLLIVSALVMLVWAPRALPAHGPGPHVPLTEREEENLALVPETVRTGATRVPRAAGGLGRGARRTLIIAGVMVVLLATGLVPPAVAGLLAAAAILLTRVLPADEAYHSISWTTIILIAGMIPLSNAVLDSGAADALADLVLGLVGTASPHLALLVVCLVTVVLGQFISNVATVLVVAPVAVSIAATLEVSALPFIVGLAVAGAAAFLTPVATPANLMVLEPGGYRFGDYWRLGLPLAVVFVAFAVLYVPLIWPF